MTMTPTTRKRFYTVCYAVTRTEYYRVEASCAAEVERIAFSEGDLDATQGETTSVKPVEIQPESLKHFSQRRR
jgi:hypothetical protein